MPATPTYILLNQVTLAAASSNVAFSNIPQTYSDLVVVCNATANSAVATIGLRFNGDSGTNYTYVSMSGNGSATFSSTNSQGVALVGYTNSTNPWVCISHVMDYSALDKHKTVLSRDDNAAEKTAAAANRWANTAAITSISVIATVNSFNSGSTFSLYGLVA